MTDRLVEFISFIYLLISPEPSFRVAATEKPGEKFEESMNDSDKARFVKVLQPVILVFPEDDSREVCSALIGRHC